MKDFLRLLMEGAEASGETPDEEIQVDDSVEKEIEECCMPMGALIETVFTDVHSSLNTAMETYEMACIVGGVRVVSEGIEQAEASVILTEATDGLWNKIKEQLVKVKNWFASMVKKLVDGFKSFGKDVNTKFKAIEADFEKNFEDGKFKYVGCIVDLTGADSIKEGITNALSSLGKVPGDLKSEGAEAFKELVDNPTGYVIGIIRTIASNIAEMKDAKTQADIVSACQAAMGYKSEGATIMVSNKDKNTMKEVIGYAAKGEISKAKDAIKNMQKNIDEFVKTVDGMKKDNADNPDNVKVLAALATAETAVANIHAAVINAQVKVISSAAKSYLGWMTQVAAGSGVTEGVEYVVEEGFDFASLLEEDDVTLDEIPVSDEPVEEGSMFANLNSMKEWFGDNSKMMKDLVNEGNSEFARKDYKKAQKCYEQAKKEANAALSSLKRIDNSVWTTVVGWLLLGWYYVILRIIAHVAVKVTAPNTKPNGEYTKKDLEAKRKECESGLRGTQKVVGGVIGEIIAFCDQQINLCKHPDKISMEGCDFDAEAASLLEEVMALFEDDGKGEEGDPEPDNKGDGEASEGESGDGEEGDPEDDDGEKEPAEEGTDLLETAMAFLT